MTYVVVSILSLVTGALFGFLCCAMLTVARNADEIIRSAGPQARASNGE